VIAEERSANVFVPGKETCVAYPAVPVVDEAGPQWITLYWIPPLGIVDPSVYCVGADQVSCVITPADASWATASDTNKKTSNKIDRTLFILPPI
jgi:hypothetical protein